MAMLDLVRSRDEVGFHELLASTRLDPEVLEHTLAQMVQNQCFREVRDGSGERRYAATAELASTADQEVLGMLGTHDRDAEGKHAA
jgi:hypothetical protein